jgi:hypothetical protein
MTAAAARKPDAPSPIDIFIARAEARALLWQAGEFDLHEAVDELQAAAERDGLIAKIGQDEIQRHMAAVFAAVRVDLGPEASVCRRATTNDKRAPPAGADETFAELCRQADERQRNNAWAATLRSLEVLVRHGDFERFQKSLSRYTAAERAAIQRHLEDKQCRR